MVSDTDRFVPVTVAVRITGVGERRLRRWIAAGRLPTVSSPHGRLVDLDAVRRLMSLTVGRSDGVSGECLMSSQVSDTAVSDTNVSTLGTDSLAIIDRLIQQNAEQAQQISRLNEERVELYGRLGYFQAQLEAAQTRILELEAPKGVPAETANHSSPSENGAEADSKRPPRRPWWRIWS